MRLIKLQYPYLDSSILAQYLAANRNKYNFTRMHKALFKKVPIFISSSQSTVIENEGLNNPGSFPGTGETVVAHIAGVKIELSGRLTTQRSIPRKTVSNKHIGSFRTTRNKHTSFVSEIRTDLNQYASKNKLGTYTIKVWLSSF